MPSATVERVLAHLWALECNPRGSDDRGYSARCPAHDDRNPSLSIGQGHDGRALVHCHRGCTLEEIAAAAHLDVSDLFEPDDKPADPAPRVVVERYDYVDEQGTLLFQVERTKPKGFRQRKPDGRGGWEYKLGDVRRVLYRLPQVVAAVKAGKLIAVVEGERDVHTLEAKGQVATCNPGGAGKWRAEYAEALRGAKVAVIQDVDPADPKTGKRPGQEHAQAVRDSLQGIAAEVKIFQPAVGNDITDHVEAGLTLGALVPGSEPRPPTKLQVLSARELMALPDPDTSGYLLGPLIYRGHRIVVGGWTGHGKTTFTLHMTAAACYGREFLKWTGLGGLRALVVDVEQGQRTVKRRLRETGLDKSDRVKYLRVPDGLALDSDAEAIAGIEKILHNGKFDIVLADPLYKLHRGDPNDTQAAVELMRRFDEWRERYQFALLLPMHCRKPREASSLSPHDLFGSSAWQWGAEMLMGVERKSESMTWLHFWKDREGEVAEDGAAVGTHWDIKFDRENGFRRYAPKQGAPKFDLVQFIYEALRINGPMTREEIKNLLWSKRRSPTMGQIDGALKKLGDRGVTHDGARLVKDRRYMLPEGLLENVEPRPMAGALAPTQTGDTEQEGGGAH
jgi:hypothetical protein